MRQQARVEVEQRALGDVVQRAALHGQRAALEDGVWIRVDAAAHQTAGLDLLPEQKVADGLVGRLGHHPAVHEEVTGADLKAAVGEQVRVDQRRLLPQEHVDAGGDAVALGDGAQLLDGVGLARLGVEHPLLCVVATLRQTEETAEAQQQYQPPCRPTPHEHIEPRRALPKSRRAFHGAAPSSIRAPESNYFNTLGDSTGWAT